VIRFLISALIWVATAAIGLLVATLVLEDMSIDAGSFVFVVVVFAALQSILTPFFAKLAANKARALLGGVGLVTTFVALFITSLIFDGFHITGASTWVFATLIVWIVTMLGAWLLPLIFVKRRVDDRRDGS
jgi:hypothetical protein